MNEAIISKPFQLVKYEIDDFIIEIITPAIFKNNFFRGAKIIIRLNNQIENFVVNTLYPVNYDEELGYNGMDNGDLININRLLDELDEILKKSDSSLDDTIINEIKKLLNYDA